MRRHIDVLMLVLVVALVPASQASAALPSPMYWSAPSVIDTRQIDGISCPSESACTAIRSPARQLRCA